jgi:hypothetical protein
MSVLPFRDPPSELTGAVLDIPFVSSKPFPRTAIFHVMAGVIVMERAIKNLHLHPSKSERATLAFLRGTY